MPAPLTCFDSLSSKHLLPAVVPCVPPVWARVLGLTESQYSEHASVRMPKLLKDLFMGRFRNIPGS